MELKGKKVGVAITGSFCTLDKNFAELGNLVEEGADVVTVFRMRFRPPTAVLEKPKILWEKAERITGKPPILCIRDAEPIGPRSLLDVLVIFPCTGNTLAKLANGITDTPVLMAAKAHLRNNKPLVISISTNDALGMNMKNIGLLLNAKIFSLSHSGRIIPARRRIH